MLVCSVAAAMAIRLGASGGSILFTAFFGGLGATVLVDAFVRTPLSGIAAALGGMLGGWAVVGRTSYVAGQPFVIALEITFGMAAWLLYVDLMHLRWRRATARAGDVPSPTLIAWQPKSFLVVAVTALVAGPFLGIVAFVIGMVDGDDSLTGGALGRIVFLGAFGGTLIACAYFTAWLLVRRGTRPTC